MSKREYNLTETEVLDSSSSSHSVFVNGDIVIGKDVAEPFIDITPPVNENATTWKFKLLKLVWDGADKHPKEQKFLFKLDFFLMSSAMLGYFIKTLNQNNVGTAYVNGMKEHYQMNGNQYNYMNTLWTVGYIIGQIPSNLILHRISARYYLAGLEICWAILTVLLIVPKNIYGLYALRFFLGLTESGYFPGLEYLIGSWYSKEEIAKRSTFFACAGTAAGLVSGPLQQRILNAEFIKGSKYLSFQWLFIFDAIISAPIGFYTLIADPNTPSTTNAFYFNREDRLIALERRRRIGAQLNTREKYTWKKIRSFFNTWHIYVFPVMFLCFNNAYQPINSQAFQLWIKKDLHLSSYYYNILPVGLSGGGIAYAILIAYFNDWYKNKLTPYFLVFMFVSVTVSMSSLAYWDIPKGYHYFCYYFFAITLAAGQPLIFSWLNRLLAHDDMKRNFLVVCTNVLAYCTGAWVPIFTFDQRKAPRFTTGFIFTAFLGVLGFVLALIVWFLSHRDEIKRGKENYKTAEDIGIEVSDPYTQSPSLKRSQYF